MATNILASRLAQLVQTGMLEKKPFATAQGKAVSRLTKNGLAFMPILREVANWRARHDPQPGAPPMWIAMVNVDKEEIIRGIGKTVQGGGSIFVGSERLVSSSGVENA